MRICEILNRAQTEDVKEIRAALEEIEGLISSEESGEAYRSFCRCISILIGCKRSDIPRALIQFIDELMKRLKQNRAGRNFIHNLIKYLLKGVDSKLKHVRVNSLVLLRGSIEHLENVSSRLWEAVKVKIGEKLFDKEVSVRMNAVHIASRYQEDLLEKGLPFYKLLKDLLRYDKSPEIRKAVTGLISINRNTVSAVITRSRDVNAGVRMVFVTAKLSAIIWKELTHTERVSLLNNLEKEREEEIRNKFLQKMIIFFEEQFDGRYEALVDAFYVENGDNTSLKKVLEEMMKRHEYSDGFGEDFLQRATPSLLFLTSISLEHIDRERGRDELILPNITVLLKSIIDHSLTLQEKDIFSGSVSHMLFLMLEYYDTFQSEEKGLIIKCGVYILRSGKATREVIRCVCKMVIKACSGSTGDRVYIKLLSCGTKRTQMLFGEALLKEIPDISDKFPTLLEIIEKNTTEEIANTLARISHTEQEKEQAEHPRKIKSVNQNKNIEEVSEIEQNNQNNQKIITLENSDISTQIIVLVLLVIQKNNYDSYIETLKSFSGISNDAILALVDCSIISNDRNKISEWLCMHAEEWEEEIYCKAISKLLLFEIVQESQAEGFASELVKRFYSNRLNEEIMQYMHVFFHEYFRKQHWMVFAVYDRVVEEIEHWKVFNDQILFWFSLQGNKLYKESDLLLLSLSSCLRAFKAFVSEKKKKKEYLRRYLDLLEKVSATEYVLDTESKSRALEMATALSKCVVKILPSNEIVKNLLFDIVSRE